jgi:hypothetical protein
MVQKVWKFNLKFEMSLNMKAYTFLLGEYVEDRCCSVKAEFVVYFEQMAFFA